MAEQIHGTATLSRVRKGSSMTLTLTISASGLAQRRAMDPTSLAGFSSRLMRWKVGQAEWQHELVFDSTKCRISSQQPDLDRCPTKQLPMTR
jgi:hypothetical protein